MSSTVPALRRALAVLTGVALTAAALVTLPPTAAHAAIGTRADDGASVIAETVIDAQTLDLTIASPALRGNGKVRLLLPKDWSTRPTATWPSLYLLHGANPEVEDYTSWTAFTDVEQFMADKNVLTVMPTDGSAGMYSAEWNFGLPGGIDYETFHTVELPQILERGYRANTTRVVGGISNGGLGAIAYTARHPGLFRAAASYSGLLDVLGPGGPQIVAIIRARGNVGYYKLWGSPLLNQDIWRSHNPIDLLPKIDKSIPLFVSSGNGLAGPLDTNPNAFDTIEPFAQTASKNFVAKAQSLGYTVTADLYGNGTHSWPYWQRELRRSWPMLAGGLGVPA